MKRNSRTIPSSKDLQIFRSKGKQDSEKKHPHSNKMHIAVGARNKIKQKIAILYVRHTVRVCVYTAKFTVS